MGPLDRSVLAEERDARLHARLRVFALCDGAQEGALVLSQLRVGPVRVVNRLDRALWAVEHRTSPVGVGQVRVGCASKGLGVRG